MQFLQLLMLLQLVNDSRLAELFDPLLQVSKNLNGLFVGVRKVLVIHDFELVFLTFHALQVLLAVPDHHL